ncbi:MAG: hypothetical protein CM15mP1_1830 [Methanobacteriota archaeon]|nr:MAG: hypothetical protein CM15mP1_1830 [Euryarchaeota archaeon]
MEKPVNFYDHIWTKKNGYQMETGHVLFNVHREWASSIIGKVKGADK